MNCCSRFLLSIINGYHRTLNLIERTYQLVILFVAFVGHTVCTKYYTYGLINYHKEKMMNITKIITLHCFLLHTGIFHVL